MAREASSVVALGLSVPFRIDAGGRVLVDGGDALLRSKVLQLLLTSPGERVNQPEFGTRLRDLVFDPNNDILAAATEFAITRALQRFLGQQIEVEGVQVSTFDSELHVDISYVRKQDLTAQRVRVGIPIPR
jgi:phage baseplate assembly protein W